MLSTVYYYEIIVEKMSSIVSTFSIRFAFYMIVYCELKFRALERAVYD